MSANRMGIGVMAFVTDRWMPLTELAHEIEARGIDSLFLPEHTHIPTSRETPFPAGEPMPDHYRRPIDPFVGLAAVAAVTSRLVIGTAVALVAQRDPIVTAKEVATLDWVSGGRFLFGVGFGWNVEEARNHGIDPLRRRRRTHESVELMRALWTNEVAEHHGEFFDFAASWQWPKPVQQPHPPVLLGASPTERTWDRVVDFADGWFSLTGGRRFGEQAAALRQRAEDRGRDPGTIRLVTGTGRLDDETLDHYEAAGAEHAVYPIEVSDRDEVRAKLDVVAEAVERRGRS